jgi:hypothetical protein
LSGCTHIANAAIREKIEQDRLAKAHGYDLRKIARALQEEEAKSGRKGVTLPAKRLRQKRAKVG